jgi:hypothetical protein
MQATAPARPWWKFELSPSPDLSSARAIAALTLAAGTVICGLMVFKHPVLINFGDTDDATRLTMVRDLLAGQGWFDQSLHRLHPPQGTWLHWSRLLDGGIAGVILLLRQVDAPAAAEYWARYAWPLLWIFPVIAGALALARNLGGRSAAFLTAILLAANLQLYRQFIPGRIDHHNVQITFAVIALACATARRDRTAWSAVGGVAAALGLAVGLEAMPLQALIGAGYGLELARNRQAGRPAMAYGLALAAATGALWLVETPPWRWGLPFCDALAVNLTAAVAVAGAGLALAGWSAARSPTWARMGLLFGAGAAAAATYAAIAPQCLHGPFAGMDPAVRRFWFDRIQEVQPLPKMMRLGRAAAITALVEMFMSLAAGLYLVARQWRAPSTSALLTCACLILACLTAWFAWRMQDYVYWIGLPALAAAFSYLAARFFKDLMAISVIAGLMLSPVVLGGTADTVTGALTRPGPRLINAGPHCFGPRGYAPLAALPPGVVFSELDLGPFVMVQTPHAVIAAPYHRMWPVILAHHQAWNAKPPLAEARVRALGATYVVDCPPYPMVVDPGSFGDLLRKGRVPSWLERLSRPGSVLSIYRLRPVAAGR